MASSRRSLSGLALALILGSCAAFALAQDMNDMANKEKKQGETGEGAKAAACRSALEAEGGESALLQRAPSCSAAATTAQEGAGAASRPMDTLRKCCDEIKAFVASDERVQKCMCAREVWEEASQRISSQGLAGVNEETVSAFARGCGLKFAGNGC
jgi:hypothetical protein